jgi:aldose 1-epimerase
MKALPELIRIGEGENVCTACPALGGSIISWSVSGQDMLRCADVDAIASGDPLALASFPLVPFSNRIGDAQFIWEGAQIELTRNFAPEPHAIHGIGWTSAWDIADKGEHYIELSLHHDGDARWPWPFAAVQRYSLTNDTLEMKLSATNLADHPVPLAFGHHPYFDQKGAHLHFSAAHVLMCGDDLLPTHAQAIEGLFDFHRDRSVQGLDIDNCYTGWGGKARIMWADLPLALEIESDLPAAVVYIPAGGDSFCFEPVPHLNNALNRSGDLPAMPVIAPGESFSAQIRLSAVEARPRQTRV